MQINIIPIKSIKPHPRNDYFFDDITGDAWQDFLLSVKTSGVIEPIVISDNDVIIERKSINEDTTLEVGYNIGDKIIGPIGLGGLHSDGEVPSKKSKTKKLSLEEMVKNNIVSVDDAVYVKGMEGEVGFLTLDGRVLYKNEKISLNQYVLKVLGPGSRNAYIFVYHKKTGKLLDELR